jgi:hypothetical protein
MIPIPFSNFYAYKTTIIKKCPSLYGKNEIWISHLMSRLPLRVNERKGDVRVRTIDFYHA